MSTGKQSAENDRPVPGPPGPPSHTHDDGTVCHFHLSSGRWWWQEEAWPHKPVARPGRVIPPAMTDPTPTPAAPSRRAEVNGEGA